MTSEQQKLWQLEKRVFQLQTLFEVAQTLSRCRDHADVYRRILATMAGTFGASTGIALIREDTAWRVVASHGVQIEFEAANAYLREHRFGAGTAQHQQELLAALLERESAGEATFTLWEHMIVRGEIVGGLFFDRKILGEAYTRDDGELLQAVCSYASHVLENLQLYDELETARQRLAAENISLRQQVREELGSHQILGTSKGIKRVLENIQNFARSDATVLIFGETGTGKELVARAIHYASPRADGPFIAINCTAIPETLVESEFFGIEAGTATGVGKRIGYFEQADRGTILIDEIGDMPLSSQAKLLRTLQERTVRRVGGEQEIHIDVRVIAATNKNLREHIKDGQFRQDLYFRLGVLELHLPPLRERREDILVLAKHFIETRQARMGKNIGGLSQEVQLLLESYPWPGNVRELENEIERLVTIVDDGEIVQPEHLSPRFHQELLHDSAAGHLEMTGTLREAVDQLERRLIRQALRQARGNKSQVARQLGLSRLGLQKKMQRLQIRYPE